MKRFKSYLIALLITGILGYSAGVGFGYTDTSRLISDGLILGSVGAMRYSIEAFEQAKRQAFTNESKAEVEASLGLVYLAAGQDAAAQGEDPGAYLQKAKEHFQAAVRLDIDNSYLHSQIGDIEYAVQNLDAAVVSYKQALQYEPESVDALFGLSRVELERGDVSQAVDRLRKAVELAPDHTGAALFLADQLALQGEYQEAVDILVVADRFDPRVPVVHFQLAQYYRALGENDKAQHEASRALDLAPGFAPAEQMLEELRDK